MKKKDGTRMTLKKLMTTMIKKCHRKYNRDALAATPCMYMSLIIPTIIIIAPYIYIHELVFKLVLLFC